MTQSGHSHQWMADLMADVRYWAKRTWKTVGECLPSSAK